MDQYANFGFDYIEEQLENDPNYFFKESAFLRVFTSFLISKEDNPEAGDEPDPLDEDEPDSLDLPGEEDAETNELEDEETQRTKAEAPWDEDDIKRLLD